MAALESKGVKDFWVTGNGASVQAPCHRVEEGQPVQGGGTPAGRGERPLKGEPDVTEPAGDKDSPIGVQSGTG